MDRGIPKWMVKIMENPIKMDDLEGFSIFLEIPIYNGSPNRNSDGILGGEGLNYKRCL